MENMENFEPAEKVEQTGSQEVVSESKPTSKGRPIKKIIWIVVGIIVILLIVLALIGIRSETPSGDITDQERQELLDFLSENPGPELTEGERSNLEAALSEGAEEAPELTDQEKQELLDALNQ